jgi:hypothetical protein
MIRACQNGTRWVEREPLSARLRKWRAVKPEWDAVGGAGAAVGPAAEVAGGELGLRGPRPAARLGALRRRVAGRRGASKPGEPPYRWTDFEFVSGDLSDAVWLCAILRP